MTREMDGDHTYNQIFNQKLHKYFNVMRQELQHIP